jgi:hypothetical protein
MNTNQLTFFLEWQGWIGLDQHSILVVIAVTPRKIQNPPNNKK